MKTMRFICAVALGVMTVFTSCEKTDVALIEGDYTYKTSGKVALLPTDYVNATEEEKAYMAAMGIVYTPQWVPLQPEQGQMHVRTIDEDESSVLITFNDLFGNACNVSARISGDDIAIDQTQEKTIVLTDGSGESLGGGFVTYSGSGTRYTDIIILNFSYCGEIVVNNISMTIVDSSVECIATLNR